MLASSPSEAKFRTGQPVRLVIYSDRGPVTIRSTVESEEPIIVGARTADGSLVKKGNRALVLFGSGSQLSRLEVAIEDVRFAAGDWQFFVDPDPEAEEERRRYPRYKMAANVEIRVLGEDNGKPVAKTIVGRTADISIGGAWVKLEEGPELGTLVDFRCALSSTYNIHALGIVVHREANGHGVGVEFIDYLGGARSIIHQFLKALAA